MGYHNRKIEKGVYGEFSKIREEFEELSDAHEQINPIMELVEISDLLGAIEAYTKSKYNINIEQILVMTDATRSAFQDGSRQEFNPKEGVVNLRKVGITEEEIKENEGLRKFEVLYHNTISSEQINKLVRESGLTQES